MNADERRYRAGESAVIAHPVPLATPPTAPANGFKVWRLEPIKRRTLNLKRDP